MLEETETGEGEVIAIGMLGAGFIGQMHSISLHNIALSRRKPRLMPRLVAIADKNLDLAKDVKARFGWEKAYDNWHDVVDDNEIEVFLNAAPNNLHRDPTIAAAEKGKHVFCEKPIARTANEAFEIWEAVERTNVIHMCAFMWRAIPAIRVIKEMVKAGELGEIRHFRSTFLLTMLEPDGSVSWRFSREKAGTGTIGDLGAHHIDVARYVLGTEVRRVGAITKTWTRDLTGTVKDINDDAFVCVAELENGATAIFEASRVANAHGLTGRIEVDGSNKSVSFCMERMNELNILEPRTGRRNLMINKTGHPNADFFLPVGIQGAHPYGWNDGFTFQDYRMFAAVRGLDTIEPYGATFRDAYRVVEIVEAIERSSMRGCFEDVIFREVSKKGGKNDAT